MRRRQLVLGAGAAGGLALWGWLSAPHRPATAAAADAATVQKRWRSLAPAGLELVDPAPALERDAGDWRAALPEDAYRVLFEHATEAPRSSPLDDERRPGLYLCRACDLALFTSEMKYDSGTGWPSFFTAVPAHLGTQRDFKLIWPRTEYHCIKCGGHQGHVFDDGPAPTYERWCNNGVALRFVPQAR